MKRPIIGITMGDPAGVGPEIAVKALHDPAVYERCRPLIVGDAGIIRRAVEALGFSHPVRAVKAVADCAFSYPQIDVLDLENVDAASFCPGVESAACGDAAFTSVVEVIRLAMAGEIDATVTTPLNKKAINMAGHHYSGHTEIYAHYTNTEKYTMLLAHENLRVVHVSTHVSLREACDRAKKARVLEVIRLADAACRAIGIADPLVAVAGLNPHSGEDGLFGREEIDEIIPAIEAAQAEGIRVTGPVPPDSIFPKALSGSYDIVVAMYHDQGHIPIKSAGFRFDGQKSDISGVNITFGLPIIRVSVDHGTAFDIAWKGLANERSLVESIDYAIRMAKSRAAQQEDCR